MSLHALEEGAVIVAVLVPPFIVGTSAICCLAVWTARACGIWIGRIWTKAWDGVAASVR